MSIYKVPDTSISVALLLHLKSPDMLEIRVIAYPLLSHVPEDLVEYFIDSAASTSNVSLMISGRGFFVFYLFRVMMIVGVMVGKERWLPDVGLICI